MTRLTLEPRLPCPVCLGAVMKKVRLKDSRRHFLLDYCPRCGGIWFEKGEVQRLRSHDERSFREKVPRRPEAYRMPCHNCQAVMDRNDEKCPACGWSNRLTCPSCGRGMVISMQQGLRVDVCETCHGAWFDHAELDAVWKETLARRGVRRWQETHAAPTAGDDALGAVLFYGPDLFFHGALSAGMNFDAGAIPDLGSAAGSVAGSIGEAAESAFDAVADIAGSVFDGFDF